MRAAAGDQLLAQKHQDLAGTRLVHLQKQLLNVRQIIIVGAALEGLGVQFSKRGYNTYDIFKVCFSLYLSGLINPQFFE